MQTQLLAGHPGAVQGQQPLQHVRQQDSHSQQQLQHAQFVGGHFGHAVRGVPTHAQQQGQMPTHMVFRRAPGQPGIAPGLQAGRPGPTAQQPR